MLSSSPRRSWQPRRAGLEARRLAVSGVRHGLPSESCPNAAVSDAMATTCASLMYRSASLSCLRGPALSKHELTAQALLLYFGTCIAGVTLLEALSRRQLKAKLLCHLAPCLLCRKACL